MAAPITEAAILIKLQILNNRNKDFLKSTCQKISAVINYKAVECYESSEHLNGGLVI